MHQSFLVMEEEYETQVVNVFCGTRGYYFHRFKTNCQKYIALIISWKNGSKLYTCTITSHSGQYKNYISWGKWGSISVHFSKGYCIETGSKVSPNDAFCFIHTCTATCIYDVN